MRTAPVAITRSPLWTSSLMPPQVPVRTKVSAPMAWSSSRAITAEGPPMPVEQTETFSPKSPGVDVKLPVVGHMDGIVKVLGDDFAPPGSQRMQ